MRRLRFGTRGRRVDRLVANCQGLKVAADEVDEEAATCERSRTRT
jgi:hypothetical protein